MDDKPVTPYDPKVHGEIPKRFLNCAKGDLAESQRRWVATVEWRASFGGSGLEYLLEHPPHNFEAIKACYPQYVHGMSKSGSYIYIERPGLADMKALLEVLTAIRQQNISRIDLFAENSAHVDSPKLVFSSLFCFVSVQKGEWVGRHSRILCLRDRVDLGGFGYSRGREG